MKNPPKQDVFEGWMIKYQIGSDLRRVHSQIFRALALTATKIWAVQRNLLKMRNFTKMKNPPKQDDFEGWIIKYQIGSNLRRVHNQIFRALASTTTKIRSVLGNPLKMRNFHNK